MTKQCSASLVELEPAVGGPDGGDDGLEGGELDLVPHEAGQRAVQRRHRHLHPAQARLQLVHLPVQQRGHQGTLRKLHDGSLPALLDIDTIKQLTAR